MTEDHFWQARPIPGSVPEGPPLWWACLDCLARPEPRPGCPVCHGTGQYQEQARPTHGARLTPEERARGAEWLAAQDDRTP